ncbi:MAG: cytochrome P450 [Candidatus Dojkabacteria bacterium]
MNQETKNLEQSEIPVYRKISLLGERVNSMINVYNMSTPGYHDILTAISNEVRNETGSDLAILEFLNGMRICIVSNSDFADTVFRDAERVKKGRFFIPIMASTTAAPVEGEDVVDTISLLTAETSPEYLDRKMKVAVLLSGNKLKDYAPITTEITNEVLEGSEEAIDLVEKFDLITLRLVLETFLGTKLSPEEDERIAEYFRLASKYNVLNYFMGKRPAELLGQGAKFRREELFFTETIVPIIIRRIDELNTDKTIRNSSMLDSLIIDGESKQQIETDIRTFLLAGQETTASVMSSVMYELFENPEVFDKLIEEILSIADGKNAITFENTSKLSYLDKVINETLRREPPTHLVPRETKKDLLLGDQIVPANTILFVNVRGMGMDKRYWENPEKFDPDRQEYNTVGEPAGYFPWGARKGSKIPKDINRRCIGENFARMSMKNILSNMILRFYIDLIKAGDISSGVVPTRPSELIIQLRERRKSASE